MPLPWISGLLMPSHSCAPIRLRRLEASLSASRHLPMLAYYLPTSVYLRHLMVNVIPDEASHANIPSDFDEPDEVEQRNLLVDGIRANGSLQFVLFMREDSSNAYFTADEYQLVSTFLIRNKQLPLLLSNPRLESDDGDVGRTDLALFPTLFCVSSDAPTNPVIGLLAAEEDGINRLGLS